MPPELVIGAYFITNHPYLDRFSIILCILGPSIDAFVIFLRVLYMITQPHQSQNSFFTKNLIEMIPIIPYSLVMGLSESLISLSECQVVFSKLIPKVCENLDAPRSGRAFLGNRPCHHTYQEMTMRSMKYFHATST